MQEVFKILPADIIPSETDFFCEVSDEGMSCFYQTSENRFINGLSVFKFEKENAEQDIATILKKIYEEYDLLKENFKKIYVSYSFNESILTPTEYYNENRNKQNLDLVYGDLQQGIILSDYIETESLHNTYRIPGNIHNAIANQFNQAEFIHQYSLLLKQLQPGSNIIKVIFYENRMVVALQKEGKLQIIQTFRYTTAEDIVYHLLNVCNQFNIENIKVQLHGMIEKDSILFKEIQKYFLTADFSELTAEFSYTDEILEFPTHFFSHLFAFALCV